MCPVCGDVFHHRAKRSWFFKHVLYFLPFRVYFCQRCEKNVYVLIKDQAGLTQHDAKVRPRRSYTPAA